jgi:hypothetical protein
MQVEDPNVCPHCHIVNNPHRHWQANSTDISGKPILVAAWTCANNKCQKLILTENSHLGNNNWSFSRFLNGLPKGPDWPKPIADLKSGNPKDPSVPEESRFIKTYLQSLVSENMGLDEIAGMGYRKAIEYLVKDWAIKNVPTDKEKIEGLWLGQVISNYYEGDLKEILERATWLGNDQAHYNKLFEEYEIADLKELIALIMVELDRQFKKNHYIETIQKRK